ncbi:hypothetical protein DXV75_08580 [Alteromonas aestuariivivens]|uniref:LPS-assembly lipoprotein LptE n=1 Tax=Alteromonas aestuariivivens TaxID=1938339 RepID=A0A3D8M8A5_9ALTE|nr:LPS assembly lipoprotein LptE [Alteromonas aestuariivivens]RDV26121.1 hypothetical protein DXV75_08580 [Alteromonas aestuariivivens]
MSAARLLMTALLVSILLAGCGFHLRGTQSLPEDANYVVIRSVEPHAPLARSLDKRLEVYDIEGGSNYPTEAQQSFVVIELLPEQLERRLLSVFSTGQVAEYELIFGVRYKVTFPGQQPIPAYFEILRDYQDDPDQVLAKSRELDLVLDEMRREAADRIIRRLPSQATQTVPVQ